MQSAVRVPNSLWSLVDAGVITEVLRPLLSGKEAEVFLVLAGGEQRVAKVYKEAHLRSFKHRADYTEGRTSRNSRDRRAIAKGSRHGKAQDEQAWRSAEVEAIYKLRAAGVRVPEPYNYMDGVLVMELVMDAEGNPAPRLGECAFEAEQAQEIFEYLLQEVVKMLCAGVVHGDLSDFNVLMSADGPVIIDFPQVVDPASNNAARRLLLRDVDNLHDFVQRYAPSRRRPYAQEMWGLYESNQLTPETRLRGEPEKAGRKANTADVLALIGEAKRDEQRRRNAEGGGPGPGRGRGRGRGPATQAQTQAAPADERAKSTAAGSAPPVAPRGRWVEVKIEPSSNDRGPSRRGARGRGGGGGAAPSRGNSSPARSGPGGGGAAPSRGNSSTAGSGPGGGGSAAPSRRGKGRAGKR